MENKLPTNITLSELVRKAKGLTAQEGILPTIQFIKKHLPENCPKYDLLILLERRYDKIVEDQVKGILSYERENEELNKTRENLLSYINGLKESDFCESTATDEPDLRIGKTMYRIPEKMQINQEAECHIWIAFDLETIVKEVQQEAGDETRDIRISNVMGVELFCHKQGEAFEITTYNETEQIIEKGLSTEWIFYVKPLKEGKFPLILRIAVIETVDGEKVHKTKVLREVIQIVSEAPEVKPSGVATKEAEGLVFMATEDKAAATPPSPPQSPTPATPQSNWRKKIPAMGGVMAIFLGLMVAFNGGLFDSNQPTEIPPEKGGSGELTTHRPESVIISPPPPPAPLEPKIRIDTAYWLNYLKLNGDTASVNKFLAEFSGSRFEKEAQERLDFLKDSLANEGLADNSLSNKKTTTTKNKDTKKNNDKVATKPTTEVTTSTSTPVKPTPKEPITSFKNVARKPVHIRCYRKKASKQESCTEDRIRKEVEDYLSSVGGLKGKGVVSFVIGADGKVTDIKMLKSDNNRLTTEVIKAIKKLSGFIPGQNQLKVPVKVAYYLPIKVVN